MEFNKSGFDQHLNQGLIMGSRCDSCGREYLPPRGLCSDCYGTEMRWQEMPQEGVLAAFTRIHIGPSAMIQAGYDRKNPYCTGIVRLSNGLAISAQILGAQGDLPEGLEIGSQLRAQYLKRGEKTILAFKPA